MVKVPDYGHRATDKQLAALSKRLQLVYRQAMFSLREKTLNYLEQFEKRTRKNAPSMIPGSWNMRLLSSGAKNSLCCLNNGTGC